MSLKKALLIGINYRGTANELGGCINDVNSMKNILIKHCGYKEKYILVLTDNTFHKPTTQNIILACKWLVSQSPASDYKRSYVPLTKPAFLFFHYSGHGCQVIDQNKDEIDCLDETICPIDFMRAGCITDDILRQYLVNLVPSFCQLICVVDACHSESSFDLIWTCRSNLDGTCQTVNCPQYLATSCPVIMISGCRDDQTSADIIINNVGQGALTYALLQTLKKYNYNLTWQQLLADTYYLIRVNNLSLQMPCLSFGKEVLLNAKVVF